MQLKEKKTSMERDKRKMESELEKQRLTIGKQVFLQVVQKKPQTESTNQTLPTTQTPPVQNLPVQSPRLTSPTVQNSSIHNQILPNTPLPTSPIPSQLKEKEIKEKEFKEKEPSRRQWDKSQSPLIDLEASQRKPSPEALLKPFSMPTSFNQNSSSTSTPSSLSSQSPPMAEVMRPKSSLEPARTTFTKPLGPVAPPSMVKDLDAELQKANSKLTELQNEISRLNLMQQKQQTIQTQKLVKNSNSIANGFSQNLVTVNTVEEKKVEVQAEPQTTEELLESNGKSEILIF